MPEPILWAHKADRTRSIPARRWNPKTKQMEQAFDEDTGQPLREKIPQRGHNGKPGDYDNPELARIPRFIHVLRHDGHCTRIPITMAAADADGADFFGRFVQAKARHFGWIPVGHCPAAMLVAGLLRPQQVVSDEARKATPCAHGSYGENQHCPHFTMEDAARKERKRRLQAKTDKGFETEAQKVIKAQQQQTSEIVTGVGNSIAEAIKALAASSAPPPAGDPPPAPEGKKKP